MSSATLSPSIEALEAPAPLPLQVRRGDLCVLGDLSGIQKYVLRPTPMAGAARRLRARSFRISAFTKLVARRIQHDLVPGLATVYAAGGRFLLAGPARGTAEPILTSFQRNLDEWSLRNWRGELVVHLAHGRSESDVVPMGLLGNKLAARRGRPLEGGLIQGAYWNAPVFRGGLREGEGRCPKCGATDVVYGDTCLPCQDDEDLGGRLPSCHCGNWTSEAEGKVSIPGMGLTLAKHGDVDFDSEDWPLLRHMPEAGDFQELAERSVGRRKLLAYLAVDVDHAGKAFHDCQGDPRRLQQLSNRLQQFFAVHTQWLITAGGFPAIYPVYGGGDDLLMVGAWDQVLRFVLRLQEDFAEHTEKEMTFSAGLILTHYRDNLRAAARQAQDALYAAKGTEAEGRNRISLCGTLLGWEEAHRLRESVDKVAAWLDTGRLSGSGLDRIVELHAMSRSGEEIERHRARPLLAWQAREDSTGEVGKWIGGLAAGAEWPLLDLIAQLAFLSAQNYQGGSNG